MEMKKKLLFINGHLNTGGVERSLVDVLRHLDYDRYEVDLLLLETTGDYLPELPRQVNVIVRCLENTYGAFAGCIYRCLRQRDWFSLRMRLIFLFQKCAGIGRISMAKKLLIGNKHYDCAIGFRPGICTQIAAFAVDAKRRISWWHHGEMNIDHGVYLKTVQNCDKVVAVSDSCRRMLVNTIPALDDQLAVIHNMLDSERIIKKAEQFQPYAHEDVLHIVSVGRLAQEKHFENAIYAAKKLKEKGILFRWHLVGDGSLRQELIEEAAKQGVEDRFVFEGNQTNPYPYIKHAHLFVHPSYVEAFGIVVAEALTLGVPCVVTKSAGVMDFLRGGENALLTSPNAEDLTKNVLAILDDPLLYNHIKKNTRCPVRFRPEAVVEKIEKLL